MNLLLLFLLLLASAALLAYWRYLQASFPSRPPAEDPLAQEAYTLGQRVISSFAARINTAHVQQFLANMISVLEALRWTEPSHELPVLRSAFPFRQSAGDQMTPDDLGKAMMDLRKATSMNDKDIHAFIDRYLEDFEQWQSLLESGPSATRPLNDVVREIEIQHPLFNGRRSLHLEDLKAIINAEDGLAYVEVPSARVLAAIVTLESASTSDGRRTIIASKTDPKVHPALQEFALAHELGHWFAHIRDRSAESPHRLDLYLHSYHELGPYETEANKLAMIALFPTPYLSWCDAVGHLELEYLLSEFIRGMPELTDKFAPFIRAYLERRIESYREYRDLKLRPVRLPGEEGSIEESRVNGFVESVLHDQPWTITDAEFRIVEVSDACCKLLEASRESLVGRRVDDFIATSQGAQEQTREILRVRRERKRGQLYINDLVNQRTGEVIRAAICAIPIVDNQREYVGSIAVVTENASGVH